MNFGGDIIQSKATGVLANREDQKPDSRGLVSMWGMQQKTWLLMRVASERLMLL